MIKEFADHYTTKGATRIAERLREQHPEDYRQLVEWVVESLEGVREYGSPDPKRIHEINDGDYQGTLVYVIGAKGYQPSDYWFVKVDYGSCSGCDTLEAIRSYEHGAPSEEQVKNYASLALHVVQGLKPMGNLRE